MYTTSKQIEREDPNCSGFDADSSPVQIPLNNSRALLTLIQSSPVPLILSSPVQSYQVQTLLNRSRAIFTPSQPLSESSEVEILSIVTQVMLYNVHCSHRRHYQKKEKKAKEKEKEKQKQKE